MSVIKALAYTCLEYSFSRKLTDSFYINQISTIQFQEMYTYSTYVGAINVKCSTYNSNRQWYFHEFSRLVVKFIYLHVTNSYKTKQNTLDLRFKFILLKRYKYFTYLAAIHRDSLHSFLHLYTDKEYTHHINSTFINFII